MIMPNIAYRNQSLFMEDVNLANIANDYGTPCYVYSRKTIETQWQGFVQALQGRKHLVCYAVKANPNLAVLGLLASLGAGFDIVSEGELERVLVAGGSPSKIVFSGVGKSVREIERALDVNIHCFNVESAAELQRINQIAIQRQCKAPISLRVNPDVDAKTHPYISTGLKENKFGIPMEAAEQLYKEASQMAGINILGIDCHIGSQLLNTQPFADALQRILALIERLQQHGIILEHIDMGGGLGIPYQDSDKAVSSQNYIHRLLAILGDTSHTLIFEPGRTIIGNAGVLLTQIEYLKPTKDKNFAIIDAAMNDLLRPALYQAWQEVLPLSEKSQNPDEKIWDIVGPICETSDFLAKQRLLSLQAGDKLAICSAGAYGFSMRSQYNSRPGVAEIMVDGNNTQLIRKRENITTLYAGESLLKSER